MAWGSRVRKFMSNEFLTLIWSTCNYSKTNPQTNDFVVTRINKNNDNTFF